MDTPLRIREAHEADAATVHGFVTQLADYEQSLHKVELAADDYARFMREGGHFNALVAEIGGEPVGMALWYKRFSTWVGDYLHLEDLYVSPDRRSAGIGRALIKKLGETAQAQGMKRMEWLVLDWNEPAIRMYRRLGASVLPDWRLCMMEEESIIRLVQS